MISPAIQTRLMDVAGESQSIAAALNHSALNLGNSLGAFLGGVAITLGFGFVAPEWVGAVLALLGLGITGISYGVEKRTLRASVAV
jgi:DHA1 family inner membrane transport protein